MARRSYGSSIRSISSAATPWPLGGSSHTRYPLSGTDIGSTHAGLRSEEHTSELQSHSDLVCRLLLEKKNITSRQLLTHYYLRIRSYESSAHVTLRAYPRS